MHRVYWIIPGIILILSIIVGLLSGVWAIEKADCVVVIKSKSTLYLKRKGNIIGRFHVVFGANPKGHKTRQGDERTPEGRYILDYKNPNSKFYKSIHISYPNERDKQRARATGVDPGGMIMIHGQPNGWGWIGFITRFFNWTDGCIALSNADMDVVWAAVDPGTPIEIRP